MLYARCASQFFRHALVPQDSLIGDQVQIEMDSQDIEKLYEPLGQYGEYLLSQIAYLVQILLDVGIRQLVIH